LWGLSTKFILSERSGCGGGISREALLRGCGAARCRLEVGQGAACGADLGGQHVQHFERQRRGGAHEAGDLVAGDEAEPRTVAGGGRERVGLVANQPRQAQQGAGRRLNGYQLLACGRCHGKDGLALVEDIKPGRNFSLVEQNLIFATRDCGGVLFQRLNQLRVGDECIWV